MRKNKFILVIGLLIFILVGCSETIDNQIGDSKEEDFENNEFILEEDIEDNVEQFNKIEQEEHVNSSDIEVVEIERYTDDSSTPTGTIEANISVFEIKNLKNKKLQDELNEKFKDCAYFMIKSYKEFIESEEVIDGTFSHPYVEYNDYSYEVVRNDDKIFTLCVTKRIGGIYEPEYYNINKDVCELITLTDFFGDEITLDHIIRYLLFEFSKSKYYVPSVTFDNIRNSQNLNNFYINNQGNVVIVFPKYAITGSVIEFEIDKDELEKFKGLLEKEVPIVKINDYNIMYNDLKNMKDLWEDELGTQFIKATTPKELVKKVDLDDDGVDEIISYDISDSDDHFFINGQELETQLYSIVSAYIIDFNKKDSFKEIVLHTDGPSEDHEICIIRYNKGDIQMCYVSGYEVLYDGEGHVSSGTYFNPIFVDEYYKIDDSGITNIIFDTSNIENNSTISNVDFNIIDETLFYYSHFTDKNGYEDIYFASQDLDKVKIMEFREYGKILVQDENGESYELYPAQGYLYD